MDVFYKLTSENDINNVDHELTWKLDILFAAEGQRKRFKLVNELAGFTRILDALLKRIQLLGNMANPENP